MGRNIAQIMVMECRRFDVGQEKSWHEKREDEKIIRLPHNTSEDTASMMVMAFKRIDGKKWNASMSMDNPSMIMTKQVNDYKQPCTKQGWNSERWNGYKQRAAEDDKSRAWTLTMGGRTWWIAHIDMRSVLTMRMANMVLVRTSWLHDNTTKRGEEMRKYSWCLAVERKNLLALVYHEIQFEEGCWLWFHLCWQNCMRLPCRMEGGLHKPYNMCALNWKNVLDPPRW